MKDERSQLFITTQPGWAFATLAELRSRGVASYVAFHHRDSSLIVEWSAPLLSGKLKTPAEVFGSILEVEGEEGRDAALLLREQLKPNRLKRQVLDWLPLTQNTRPRRYSVVTEVRGAISLQRNKLSELVDRSIREAFPRWKRVSSQALRFYCKVDPQAAVLGVQLYANLTASGEGAPGSLRSHLACGLLTMAGAGPGEVVFDPFMGTGTILREAYHAFGVPRSVGLEVDRDAYRIAERTLDLPAASLHNVTFESFDATALPDEAKLVSNIPFGVRFAQVSTGRLLDFIRSSPVSPQRITMLMSRGQARGLAPVLNLRAKNVLVLGQPAAIVYTPRP